MAWKSEKGSENPEGNIILKNSGRENNFEVEKVGCENSIILNHTDSNHTGLNHANWNKLITTNLTTSNDSDNFFTLN